MFAQESVLQFPILFGGPLGNPAGSSTTGSLYDAVWMHTVGLVLRADLIWVSPTFFSSKYIVLIYKHYSFVHKCTQILQVEFTRDANLLNITVDRSRMYRSEPPLRRVAAPLHPSQNSPIFQYKSLRILTNFTLGAMKHCIYQWYFLMSS
eukprot:COSAG02_NODE_3188_length_7205_cov_25.313538_11_plen_150_part_00